MPLAQDAERVCAYLVERVQLAAGPRWAQGEHVPALGAPEGWPAVETVARRRLWRVPRHVAVGLCAWARGARDVELLCSVPTPRHVLRLQATGRRCVSILPAGTKEDGLAFALHDLCHLEKFAAREHHDEQVGFFGRLAEAMDAAGWRVFDRRYDEAWRKDVEHVAADMNGSAIFLFAALKMKLKMAVRRELARAEGRPSPTFGPLTDDEARAFDVALGEMLDLLALEGEPRDAALAVSTKRDTPADAVRLQAWFASLAPPRPRMLGA